MADINYECPSCGYKRMVSEFADPTKILCRECDCQMLDPKNMEKHKSEQDTAKAQPAALAEDTKTEEPSPSPSPTTAGKKNKLKLAREKAVPPPPEESSGVVKSKKELPPEDPTPRPLELHPKKKPKKPLVSQSFIVFLLFLAIGGLSYFVRYGIAIETTPIAPALDYAWVAVLLCHLWIVGKAFSVDVMQGIICFFVPGWSFIYLALSDHMYQKALIFGLLIGIGYDGAIQLLEYGSAGFSSIQEFIESGGGDLRRR